MTDRATQPELAVHSLVDGRYRIEKEIGRGAVGCLYRAFDLGLERPCALKMLQVDSGEGREALRREAAALAAVRDRHVAEVYAYGVHDGCPYFAMEFVRGRTLASIVAEHDEHGERIPWERSVQLLREICDGMSGIHRVGVIHRDIKPDNIVVEDLTARAVLVDFGCAVVRDRWDGLISGTPKFLCPEYLTGGRPSVGGDLYAFGCLAFQLFTNRVPYTAGSFEEVMLAHATAPIPRLAEVRPELAAFDPLLQRLLAKQPSDRPTNASLVRNEIDDIHQQLLHSVRQRVARYESGETLVARAKPAGLRVLVVDDDVAFCKLAARCAMVAHADVPVAISRATSVADAVASVSRLMPNLVLLDYLLSDGNGIDVLSRIRSMPGGHQVAVIVASAFVTHTERWRFDALGVTEFVDKPVDFAHLADCIQRVSSSRGWTFSSTGDNATGRSAS